MHIRFKALYEIHLTVIRQTVAVRWTTFSNYTINKLYITNDNLADDSLVEYNR